MQQRAQPVDVVTRACIAAPPGAVWDALVFYEQIEQRPPLLLRLLLPEPRGTEGNKSRVGDEARCLYASGHLLKRVTELRPPLFYGFEVAEQHLGIGFGIRLSAGSYMLRALPDERTELAVSTRYTGGARPQSLFGPVERAVCHAFHRHLLRAIARRVAEQPRKATPGR
jgi:hypothetical protein